MPDQLDAYIDEILLEIPDNWGKAGMDAYIEEILQGMPDPEGQQFTDLDDRVPYLLELPADEWVELMSDAKEEFDGAAVVFSTWRVEEEGEVADGDTRTGTENMGVGGDGSRGWCNH